MQKLFYSLILLLGSITFFAQPVNQLVGDVVMPPPNAAALGKYADIPVSNFTGTSNINVPIYTVENGPLRLPIGLGYHTGGIKIGESASWVGLGWALSAGGMISRTTQSLPDEDGYYTYGAASVDPCVSGDSAIVFQATQGQLDAEPDIFSFNFAGYSGKFYFDGNQNIHLVPRQDIIIEEDTGYINAISGTSFQRFIFTTPDGTRYYFGTAGLGNTSPAVDVLQDNQGGLPFVASWHLVRVESTDGYYQIDLEYTEEEYSYKQVSSCMRSAAYCGVDGIIGGQPNFSCIGQSQNGTFFIRMDVEGQRLSKITSPTSTVTFVGENDRPDLDPITGGGTLPKQLDSIRIQSGSFCKSFAFYYDYFLDNSDPSGLLTEYKRLKLDSVQEVSCDGALAIPPYRFDYYGFMLSGKIALPNRLSRSIDHWGYLNGANNSGATYNIPPTLIEFAGGLTTTFGTADRESDEDSMIRGMLQRITYPTGGHRELTYEANRYLQSGTVESIDFPISPVSNCTYPNETFCCPTDTTILTKTFSQAEIDNSTLKMTLTDIGSYDENLSCNSFFIDILLTVYEPGNQSPYISVGFGVDTLNNQDSTYERTLDSFTPQFLAGVEYTFELITSKGKGTFEVYRPVTNEVENDRLVGGLRIQQVRTHDGIDTLNDIIRTYSYVQNTVDEKSSGHLFREPMYGFALTSFDSAFIATLFQSTSITPLANFEGYHIGYERVVEHTSGMGDRIYTYHIENAPPNGLPIYPYTPDFATVRNGKLDSLMLHDTLGHEVYSRAENPVGYSYEYTTSDDVFFKVASILLERCESLTAFNFVNCYNMRTDAYRVRSIVETQDGVTTSTRLDYDPADRHLQPVLRTVTNSDAREYRTRMQYPHDFATTDIDDPYSDMVERNMISMPIEVRQEVATDSNNNLFQLVDGQRTEYEFFNPATGFLSGFNNNTPPRRLNRSRYEMSWDKNGNTQTTGWELQDSVLQYHPVLSTGEGYPKLAQTNHWGVDTLEWNNGLIARRAYEDFEWQYDYYTGTRMVQKITEIDGQDTDVWYDALMRPLTIIERDFQVITDFEYQYKDATHPYNYVRTTTGYTTVGTRSDLSEFDSWQYLDGLARPIQLVQSQHSPDFKDVILHQQYDKQGRVFKKYEPFESANSNGSYIAAIPDSVAYTLTGFEPSPLSRPVSVTPPGWFATTTTYGANANGEVPVIGVPSSFYAPGNLSKTVVTDPDGRQTSSFQDKLGRTVLVRQDTLGGSYETDTYFLYDDKSRESYVIPPGASLSDTALIYRKIYDGADNVVEQFIPGAGSMLMQYSNRDLLTVSQDARQVIAKEWIVSDYDTYGRPTVSGFYFGPLNPDPNAPVVQDSLTHYFYDGQSESGTIAGAQYIGRLRQSKVALLDDNLSQADWIETFYEYDVYGRMTKSSGNNHRNLSDYTSEVMLYDQYDWADNLLYSIRTSKAFGVTTKIEEQSYVDHQARLAQAIHEINDLGNQTLSLHDYTVKDELRQKQLGLISGNNYLQTVDYKYNQQGWLTGINDNETTGLSGNDLFKLGLRYNTADASLQAFSQKGGNIAIALWQVAGSNQQAYGYQYDYLNRLTQSTSGEYFGTSLTANNNYGTAYAYDVLGNMQHLSRNGLYSGAKQQIDVLDYDYYQNSNKIKTITDEGDCPSHITIAEPIYSNVVIQATDSITLLPGASISGVDVNLSIGACDTVPIYSKGFVQRSTGNYAYDANGNLVRDPNKKVTITYNHLNLPETVEWYEDGVSKAIELLYDAEGTKLQTLARRGSDTLEIKDYFGGIEYTNDTIEAIYHMEGRAVIDDNQEWQYQYIITDHVRNSRLLFTEKDGTAQLIGQWAYYPFGLEHQKNDTLPYRFNGLERNNDFNLDIDLAFFRSFDPATARWWQIDPKYNVHITPYSGFGNNPALLADPLGDTTRLYNSKGELIYTINDQLKNQEHFLSDEIVANLNLDALGKFNEAGGSHRLILARILRKSSKYYIGSNTRADLLALSERGTREGAEAYGNVYVSESRELRINDLSDRIEIVRNNRLPSRNCDNCRNARGVSIIDAVGVEFARNAVMDVHTHGKYSAIAEYGGRAGASNMFNLLDLGRPSGSDYSGSSTSSKGNFSNSLIATPYGYTIYEVGDPIKGVRTITNFGQSYDYNGRLRINR